MKPMPWLRLSTAHTERDEIRDLLDGGTPRGIQDYAYLMMLYLLLGRSPDGYVDVSNQRKFNSFAHDLYMSPRRCGEFLARLVETGNIDRECYEEHSVIVVTEVRNAVEAYHTQVRANRRNGRKGGRPRKDQDGNQSGNQSGNHTG